ncbi:MAG: NUDIX hydrolase [Clostridia bacterium]|nr:NUDIX hydrolase [Clostridia bacterium]
MNKDPYEKVLSKKEVFHGVLISVEHWEAEIHGEKRALREIVRHTGAAAVVPIDEQGAVTLVEQYRIATGRTMLELPAGKKNSAEEDSLLCAKRELREETGLTARDWRLLSTIETSPGFTTERIALYMATGLSQGEACPDEGEYVHSVIIPMREAIARVARGDITDAKTVSGLMLSWYSING